MAITSEDKILEDLKKAILKGLGRTFERYHFDVEKVLTPMKWKPLVLIVGNYSSGKSTFINELIERDIQRTGQAPTDDSFTILSYAGPDEEEEIIPGSTVVNDPTLPFEHLRSYGQSLISHLWLKKVKSDVLKDFAIIDTPGMLDSVTEKDRGYDYLGVIGEFSRLADCIVLMFDPHKAGTIKETYEAIRSTLPGATGEDRIIYCLNRIDECDNIQDLVRSYGALCWNLSQMTGRKDMPRIYLTYSSSHAVQKDIDVTSWDNERDELISTIKTAPRMRLSHILQDADRAIRELGIVTEFMKNFKASFWEKVMPTIKVGILSSILAFFVGDVLSNLLIGFPDTPFLTSLLQGHMDLSNFIFPIVNAVLVITLFTLYLQRLLFPRHIRRAIEEPEGFIDLDTTFKKDLWKKAKTKVVELVKLQAPRLIWMRHEKAFSRVNKFLEQDLQRMFELIGPPSR
ncbi:hypothetical protein DBT_2150 [Dissulfuribacter thermophilus]|uniref:Dynamin N-terminal domain-containing protein n=1 Tax=Dissulfuribacter thermophilus TaxID=1156395 RepID=A0A1B9F3S8_9BACT|nr:dynamin family protein [Dissulfuribacter thermophilus]OCC14421.1 hypothetical protein DBT_2150 [Dissulfuribacter thermophilus]